MPACKHKLTHPTYKVKKPFKAVHNTQCVSHCVGWQALVLLNCDEMGDYSVVHAS